jgi:malonyl CoA-acyl carrier protein transacylase
MVAVNPQRVGAFFGPQDLNNLCDDISKKSGKLLQIVNYNVDNWQYIVTGHNANLEALRVVLTTLKEHPTKKQELPQLVEQAMEQFPASFPLYSITSGPATMPLPGVDVPFHSQSLLGEVPRFREYLLKTLDHKTLDIELLEVTKIFCFIVTRYSINIFQILLRFHFKFLWIMLK